MHTKPSRLPPGVEQPMLLDAPIRMEAKVTSAAATRQRQFEMYDATYPQVYREVRRIALSMLRSGRPCPIAVIAFFSIVRPYVGCGISNSLAPNYARQLVARDARLTRIIDLKPLHTSEPDVFARLTG